MERLYYKGYSSCESVCDYERNGSRFIVHEIKSNSGTSITNAITTIATMLCTQFEILPSELVIIEKHPENDKSKLSTYTLAGLKEHLHYFNGQDDLFECPGYRPLDELEALEIFNAA